MTLWFDTNKLLKINQILNLFSLKLDQVENTFRLIVTWFAVMSSPWFLIKKAIKNISSDHNPNPVSLLE